MTEDFPSIQLIPIRNQIPKREHLRQTFFNSFSKLAEKFITFI